MKEKQAVYQEISDLYRKINEAQLKARSLSDTNNILVGDESERLFAKGGLPAVVRQYIQSDINVAVGLFHSLCGIVRNTTNSMSEHVSRIEAVIEKKGVDLMEMLQGEIRERYVEGHSEGFESDEPVFLFLIRATKYPWVEAAVERIRGQFDPRTWLKADCPICGSSPYLSVLKLATGKRYGICAYCGFEWQIPRITCPFCSNSEQGSLNFFYSEEEDWCRIDICEKCRSYVKTIDLRKRGQIDPILEDLVTLHLDMVASQQGYKRRAFNYWFTPGVVEKG